MNTKMMPRLVSVRMVSAIASAMAVALLLIFAQHQEAYAQQSGATHPAQPSVELPPELARVLTDYEAAWRKRDAAALALLFAEDGYVLPGGFPPIKGRKEIERYYTGQGGPLSLRAIHFAADGKVGYIIGGYAQQKGEEDMGKFTLTLRKGSDGRWLIVSDMDSPNRRRQQ